MDHIPVLPLDCRFMETTPHGKSSFPIQYYTDDLACWHNQTVPLHWHSEPEFFSVTGGSVDVQTGNKHVLLSEGNTILISGNQLHSYRQITKESECICPNIVFSADLIAPRSSEIYNKYLLPILYQPSLPYIVFDSDTDWHQELLETLFHTYTLLSKYGSAGYYQKHPDDFLPKQKTSSPCYEMEVLRDLCRIFEILNIHKEQLPLITPEKNELTTQVRLQKMISFIQTHYSEKITVTEIASAADVSRSEAGRCFQNFYQISPMEYVTQCRLEHAQSLLCNSSFSVKEIGFRCGFQDASYFVKTFHKYMQMTPSAYRQQIINVTSRYP
ncbi:MAG: helix-turn-helix domain-containing protein [Oliverpabstia sp.]